MQEKPLTRLEKLQMILRLLEAREPILAYNLVNTWGQLYRDIDPVIAGFVRNDERQYWLEYEPLCSDLRAAITDEEQKS